MLIRTLIALLTLIPCLAFADSKAELPSSFDVTNFNLEKLQKGFQGISALKPTDQQIGKVLAPTLLYQLPEFSYEYEITIISHVNDKETLFYPIMFLLDQSGSIVSPVRIPFQFKKTGRTHPSLVLNLKLKPTDRYILVTSFPEWFGKSVSYISNTSTVMPIYGSPNPIYVPVPGNSAIVAIKLDREPELEFRLPYEYQTRPLVRQEGYFMNLGASTGGDFVYRNPDGDNYRAGGGAIIGIGYSHQAFDSPFWMARYELGIRYQGGKGGNRGVVAQPTLVYSQANFNVGAGLYGDFANSAEGEFGQKTDFKPALGFSAFAEWRTHEKFNFGIRYVVIDYESKDGVEFAGEQAAVYMSWWLY